MQRRAANATATPAAAARTPSPPLQLQTVAHTVQGDLLSFEVPVTTDPASGDRIVMLQPVLDVFPETVALCSNDNTLLPFLTNPEGLLMVPMRVAYRPGETLYVVPATTEPNSLLFKEQAPWSAPAPSWSGQALRENIAFPPQTRSSTNPFRPLASAHDRKTPTSSLSSLLPPSSSFTIDMQTADPFGMQSLWAALPSNVQTEQEHDSPSQRSTRGAALLSQSMPLSEQPVPRLFIVLPDPKPRHWAETQQPLSGHHPRTFRLYFLCDCGEGATFPLLRGSNASTQRVEEVEGQVDVRNCIHVADQPGYEVLNLKQFSEQFGDHTLLILRLFQQGINNTAPRGCIPFSKIAIPPLCQSHYSDILQPFTWEIEERVATAIETLQEMTVERGSLQTEEAVPLTDLRRLWECIEGLQVGGESHAEGMLRVFVHDGTVRWICQKHYHSTFEYLQEDRDIVLWRCREIFGDNSSGEVSEELEDARDDMETEDRLDKAVAFDDRKKHLRLSGTLSPKQVRQLGQVLEGGYMIQQVTLTCPLSSIDLLESITDMISASKVALWCLSFISEQQDASSHHMIASSGAPSSAPPPYSQTSKEPDAVQHNGSLTSRSRSDKTIVQQAALSKGRPHPVCNLFVLGQIESLQIPDFSHRLFDSLSPSPGEFTHLRRLRLWGSDISGQRSPANSKNFLDFLSIDPWCSAGLGALLRAFDNLTELHLTNIDLGARSTADPDQAKSHQVPDLKQPLRLMEIAQSLLYLPRLSVLELSSCGLLKENCSILSSSLALLDNRITHLDVHNNDIQDEGLAELLWAVGRRLFALDARNTGFGNFSAFALTSMLQSHENEVQQNRTSGWGSRMAIYRILKLEESCGREGASRHTSSNGLTETTLTALDKNGRESLVRALELLEPKELCLRLGLGFQDADFASAFSGMKNLECLERLQVSNSNFGPLALAAMFRIFRATSCRIRELEIHSTLLSETEQREALDQILNI